MQTILYPQLPTLSASACFGSSPAPLVPAAAAFFEDVCILPVLGLGCSARLLTQGLPCCEGTGPRHTGSVVAACRLFLNQGSNLCPPCRQADSKPVHPQGSPTASYTCFINQSVQLLFVEGLGLPWSLRW